MLSYVICVIKKHLDNIWISLMNSSDQAKADRKNANKSKYAHCKKGEMNIKIIFFTLKSY